MQKQKTLVVKKLYQIGTSAGKLNVEVNAFKKYFFVIVTYASLLKMDGSLQIAQKTRYNDQPTVLSLVPQSPSTNEKLARELCKAVGMPVILSLNIQLELTRKGEDEILQALIKLCRLHLPTSN